MARMARMADLILAIDQGTTGSTAVIVDRDGVVRGRSNLEFPQHFPQPGWVEHEPDEIWASVMKSIALALERAKAKGSDLAAIAPRRAPIEEVEPGAWRPCAEMLQKSLSTIHGGVRRELVIRTLLSLVDRGVVKREDVPTQ